MEELWGKFIIGLCKVDAVCWNGEPNWLGWAIIIVFGAGAASFLYGIFEEWADRENEVKFMARFQIKDHKQDKD